MRFRTIAVAVVCCLVIASTVGSAAVAGTTGSTATPQTDQPAADNACFPGDGFEFTIGTEGPEITVILHLSLLTNLGGPGGFGVELAGSMGGPPIVELRTGVLFDGVDNVSEFLNDPFGPFSIAFEYIFELPMFGEEFAYEESDAPIDGPIDETAC